MSSVLSSSTDISIDDQNEDQVECFSSATLTLSNINSIDSNDSIHSLNSSPSDVDQNQTQESLIFDDSNHFFGLREELIERAFKECKPVILETIDGSLRGQWLLTEIDHWDNEKERLIFVCDRSLIVMKYDLITLKLLEYKRYLLSQFDRMSRGPLQYPEESLIPSRNQMGIRFMWNRGQQIQFAQKWNPWSKSVPWLTLTSHPLVTALSSHPNRTYYDINHFNQIVTQAIQQNINHMTNNNNNNFCQIVNEPIVIENYVNLVSAFHNITNMGFFKSRGIFSF